VTPAGYFLWSIGNRTFGSNGYSEQVVAYPYALVGVRLRGRILRCDGKQAILYSEIMPTVALPFDVL